jgi:hypothetical protein
MFCSAVLHGNLPKNPSVLKAEELRSVGQMLGQGLVVSQHASNLLVLVCFVSSFVDNTYALIGVDLFSVSQRDPTKE